MNGTPLQFPHLRNAPITEAIIDFRAKLRPDFDVKKFHSLRQRLENEFPEVEEISQIQFEFQSQPGKFLTQSQKDLGIHGVAFRSADKLDIVQFQRGGFTFNRLKPYTSWEEVFGKASELWKLYVATASPVEVSHIATRYINQMQFPMPLADLSRYLKVPAGLPEGWPQVVSGFLTKVVVQEPDEDITANITLVLESSPDNRHLPVIFDIDVLQKNVSNIGTDELHRRFAKLREMKNRIFFGGLTQEAINLFK